MVKNRAKKSKKIKIEKKSTKKFKKKLFFIFDKKQDRYI